MICVYRIKDVADGKEYVGSTTDYKRRVRDHIRMLKTNRHYNSYLQRAWNKHGENSFVFEVVEECSKENLRTKEFECIENTNPEFNLQKIVNQRVTFRHSNETKKKLRKIAKADGRRPSKKAIKNSVMANRKVWKGFISPSGIEYRNIANLPAFCRKHKLSHLSMVRLGNKKITSHRKWKNIDAPEAKPRFSQSKVWNIVSPEGVEYRNVENLSEFARRMGLGRGLVNIGSCASHYKGWRRLL